MQALFEKKKKKKKKRIKILAQGKALLPSGME